MDTTIAEWTRVTTETTEGMRRIAETKEIAGSATTAAHRATCTTVRVQRRSLLKGTETRCAAGGAKAINGKIHVPAGSAAMTVVAKREATSRGVRRVGAEADSVAGAAEAAGAAAVAVAGADREQFYVSIHKT